ncbi:MAG: hypothetical protein GC181_16255 [Bacteroidetes bacterium]|nr:hypothetical protein [Bacteroidota bacterium]
MEMVTGTGTGTVAETVTVTMKEMVTGILKSAKERESDGQSGNFNSECSEESPVSKANSVMLSRTKQRGNGNGSRNGNSNSNSEGNGNGNFEKSERAKSNQAISILSAAKNLLSQRRIPSC